MPQDLDQFDATLSNRLARYRSASDANRNTHHNNSTVGGYSGRLHAAIESPPLRGSSLIPPIPAAHSASSSSNSSDSSRSTSRSSVTSSTSEEDDESGGDDSDPLQKNESVDAFLDSVLSEDTEPSGVDGSVLQYFLPTQELGRGGCGTVYQAVLADGRLAAVKELRSLINEV